METIGIGVLFVLILRQVRLFFSQPHQDALQEKPMRVTFWFDAFGPVDRGVDNIKPSAHITQQGNPIR